MLQEPWNHWTKFVASPSSLKWTAQLIHAFARFGNASQCHFLQICSRGHNSMRTEVDRQVSVKAPGIHKYVGVVGCSHQVAYCGEETAVQQN